MITIDIPQTELPDARCIDDGSTDRSPAIVRGFAERDARIRPIFSEHGGRPYARNLGIQAARGEWIAWQDADDVSLPERFAAQLAWLDRGGRLWWPAGFTISSSNAKI